MTNSESFSSLSSDVRRLSELSLVFPAYNEEKIIRTTISRALDFAPQVAEKYEIVVVNDGSSDRTGMILDELAEKNSQISVIHHPRNKGYGAALRSGLYGAKYSHIFYTDSDGQFDITEIPLLMPYIGKADIVTGYRKSRQDSFQRKFNAGLIRNFNRIFLGLKLRDVDGAFKIYHRKVLESIVLHCDGILIDTEIFYKAQKKGFAFYEVPVSHFLRSDGAATGSRLDVLWRVICELPNLFKE